MTLTAAHRRIVIEQQQLGGVAFKPPKVTAPTLWVDMSNWTGELSAGMLDDLRAAGYVGAVVQAITGNDGVSYTAQQLAVLKLGRFRIAGYVWCFAGASPSSMQSRLAMFDGYSLEFLALDVEQGGVTRADVDRDLAVCDTYIGRPTWVYSGKWFFDLQGWSAETWWADRLLWDSNYTGVAEVGSGFKPYGGWTKPTMTQFLGTSTVGRLQQVDLNIKSEGV